MSGISTRMVVHALVQEDGSVAGGELYEVAALIGMTDQQVRLCVKRLVTEGRFTVEGRGRGAVLRLAGPEPGAGLPLIPEGEFVRHAYRQDRGLEPWDGLWHAFAFAVPESARAARDSLRDALTGLGAAPVQGGLYVTPNEIGPYVRAHAAELDLPEALTCLSTRDLAVGGTCEPRALAERLWPLPEIAARYGSSPLSRSSPPRPADPPDWRTPWHWPRPSPPRCSPTRCSRRSCCRSPGRARRPGRRRPKHGPGWRRPPRPRAPGCSACTARPWPDPARTARKGRPGPEADPAPSTSWTTTLIS